MGNMIARIDHIGIAVQNITDALQFFQDALGMKLERVDLEEGGRTQVAFLPVGSSDVELVESQDADSGLAKFLAKRGEGIHHICFEVDDIDAALARLKELQCLTNVLNGNADVIYPCYHKTLSATEDIESIEQN